MTEREFIDIKKTIEDKQTEITRAQGARDNLMNSLQETYGCKTVEEAQVKLEGLEKDLDSKTVAIEDLEKSLVELMDSLSA